MLSQESIKVKKSKLIHANQLQILFIINDSIESIFARRIINFTKYFSKDLTYKIVYRDNKRKISSIFSFVGSIIKHNPKIVYLEQIAYSGCLAVFLARLFVRFKYVFCVSDAYGDLLRSRYSNLVVFFAKIMERLWLNSADFVLTWNPLHAKWLNEQIKMNNIVYVECGVDIESFKPTEHKSLSLQLGLDGSLVIGLVGSLIWSKRYHFCYGWDLIEALKVLKDLDIKALIVGDGSGLAFLKDQVRLFNLEDRVVFTGRVPNEKIVEYINCMDICISTQSNDLVGYLRCPTKLSEYMACGRYIISTDVGYAKLYVDKVGKLLSYTGVKDETYPRRLAEHIREVYFNRQELEKGKEGISIACLQLSNAILGKRLEKILLKVINNES